jgi:hypothetical protein
VSGRTIPVLAPPFLRDIARKRCRFYRPSLYRHVATVGLHKAHLEGMQRGRELALQQYDRAFLELADKMDNITRKLDTVLEARER